HMQGPRFLPYASHFLAMLIGEMLLERMGISPDDLNHQNLAKAREHLSDFDQLHERAVLKLRILLRIMGVPESSSLQKLSATFRRGDLLEALPGLPALARVEAGRMETAAAEWEAKMDNAEQALARVTAMQAENSATIHDHQE